MVGVNLSLVHSDFLLVLNFGHKKAVSVNTAWMAKVQGLIWVAFGFRLSLEEVCLGYASMRKACSSPRCLSPAPAPNHVESSRWS